MPSFFFERRVEFCETDAAGIVHFSSLLQYAEQAEHALLRHLGFSVHTGRAQDVSWPRVHVEMDFAGPAKFEDLLSIEVFVLELGDTSVRYGFRIIGPMGKVARGETVAVCCMKRHGDDGQVRIAKVPIPEPLRNALQTFRQTSDGEH